MNIKIFRKCILQQKNQLFLDTYIYNQNFLNEIYAKFLFRYLNKNFYIKNVSVILSLYCFDPKNKVTLIDKSSYGEYKLLSFLCNIILREARKIIRNSTNKNICKNIKVNDIYSSEFLKIIDTNLSNNVKKYRKKISEIIYIIELLHLNKFNLLSKKSDLAKCIIELVIFKQVSPKIVYSDLLNTNKTTTYRIIDKFYNEVNKLAKNSIYT